MYSKLTIKPLSKTHILALIDLWKKQFTSFCSNSELFSYWKGNTGNIEDFIERHAAEGRGVAADIDGKTVGYLAFDTFRFHGADSAFIFFAGNASILENRDHIYLSLYKALAQSWVDQGIKNHYFTICAANNTVKHALFDVGFGSYVVDAFLKPKPIQSTPDTICSIKKADESDANALFGLVKESLSYYSESPIFLKMENYPYEELMQLIKTGSIFIAKLSGEIVGFMSLTIAENFDIYRMCAKGFGQINEIGAYIKQSYRNQGIGRQLIAAMSEYCQSTQVPCIHVDFESANLYANKFWPKHFTPLMLSMKRTIHSDI